MNRREFLWKSAGAGLVAAVGSSNLSNIVRAEAAKQPTSLAEKCKDHKKYVPKPEVKARYDALEQRYNKECHEEKNCGPVIKELEALVKVDPNYPDPYLRLGTAFIETKEYEKAIPSLETAVKLEPCDSVIRRNYGMALAENGIKKNDKQLVLAGINEYKKILELENPNSDLYKKAQNAIKNYSKYLI